MTNTTGYGAPMSDAAAERDAPTRLPRDPFGTIAIVAGTAVAALSIYVFQVIAGRSLGTTDFAPIGVIWSVQFLVFTVLDVPVEQYVTRRLTIGGGRWISDRRAVVATVIPLTLGVIIGTAFVLATRDRFFGGSAAFAAVMAGLLVSRAVASLGRGSLVGRRRFRAYGGSLGLEGAVGVALAAAVATTNPTTLAFAAILPISPLVVFLTRPFRPSETMPVLATSVPAGYAFLWALVAATAASQIILASGPVVVGFIGGTAAAISVIFVTFSLFRSPVTSSYPLVARVLPDFTAIAAAGDDRRLNLLTARLGAAGAAAGVLFGFLGWILGPAVVELLYGSEFAPSSPIAALAAAAVGFALASLFLNQIYVARGETGRLAAIWWTALAIASATLLMVDGEPVERVAVSFLIGEAIALVLLVWVAVASHLRSTDVGAIEAEQY